MRVHAAPVESHSVSKWTASAKADLTSHHESADGDTVLLAAATEHMAVPEYELTLADWIAQAVASNPQILRLQSETRAAWQRVPQARALPDPMLEGSVFGEPQMMADGEMRGTFMISQSFPFFKQLGAQEQQAIFEAMILQQETEVARLRIMADIEESWYRLYLLGQLVRLNEANGQLITSLIEVATGRVKVGEATAGDVILGTLSLARIEEEQLMLRQQIAARKAVFNQLVNRHSDASLEIPETLADVPPTPSLEEMRATALRGRPEVVAARLRTEATAWGIEVARLKQVPEVKLGYENMFMRMNPGEHGSDPWRVSVGINVPLWRGKYNAMKAEAQEQHLAAHRGVEEAIREYDAVLLDLLEQARSAERTAHLYRDTILPQSRQSLDSDQRAYAQGAVTFERVISDSQNLLTAEAALQRAMVERAVAVARLKQTVGGELPIPIREPQSLLPAAEPASARDLSTPLNEGEIPPPVLSLPDK